MFQPWDPYAAGQIYLKIWKRVTGVTGMPYPEDLRYMALTTDPPCLLVKAAELQGSDIADKVLRRFRESVFLYGTPVDSIDQAAMALDGIPGLNVNLLLEDAAKDEVISAYLADWQETRSPNDYVRGLAETETDHLKGGMMFSEGHERYNLPTFIFKGPAGERTVPGYRPYTEYEEALEAVAPGILGQAEDDPTAEQALGRWPTMTSKEIEVVCDTPSEDPGNARRFECGGAHVWLDETEEKYWKMRQE
jgi:hypothetical protein